MSYTVSIITSEHMPDGTPIVRSHTISGNVTEAGNPLPDAEIVIIEPVINDEGSGVTDASGNFRVVVAEDTMHHIYVNGELSGQVKVAARR